MKNTIKKILLVVLALTLVILPLASCAKDKPDSELEMKIYLLNGTTALGASKLICDAKNDALDMNYKIETFASADAITGAIVSGECAIAALPTNAAANLYKKSEGKIQLLAINTLGVLYLLSNGVEVTDFNSLKGKTIYLPGAGSNPEFITAALINANGLEGEVKLDTTTYNSPDALSAAVTAGLVSLAVLPEPKVTVVTSGNADVKVAMDFTDEWEKLYGENTMAQGCLVVNSEFAKEHPVEVSKFLDDYKASVEFISEATDDSINAIVDAGILPKAPIAKKALPNCNICFIEGKDMKDAISVFYEKLHQSNNKSIAAIPDDGFYYER
ncbi:MAG: ABC transporter substrate-binding protein [Clostridia bacterium]|nr:ABC transporter substrate-binding protein [Clostridia bacterium]